MTRFSFLEAQGAAVAAISDIGDGNCSGNAASAPERRAFLEQCGIPAARLVCPKQVHGVQIVAVGDEDVIRRAAGGAPAEGDGLITDIPGLPLGVGVADCVPVFLYDAGRRAVGILHAGREGTEKNIAGAGVAALGRFYSSRPQDMYAVIGPSAGPCCYEVSEELAERFFGYGWPGQGRYLDLWGANRKQLLEAGVPEQQIEISGHCTICGGAYHSYRLTGTKARNLAVIMG